MRTLSKLFRAAALCLVVAALTVPGRAADLDKLIPADAEAAVVLNVKGLRETEAYRLLGEPFVKAVLLQPPVAKILNAAGLDPLGDLSTLTSVTVALGGKHTCLVFRGKFDVARCQATIAEAVKTYGLMVETTKEGGSTYYTLGNLGLDLTRRLSLARVTVAFVGTDALVVATDPAYLKQIVAGKAIEATPAARTFRAAFANLDGKHTLVWAGTPSDEFQMLLGFLVYEETQFRVLAPNVTSFSGSFHVSDGFDIVASAHAADADAAKRLGAAVMEARRLRDARLGIVGPGAFFPSNGQGVAVVVEGSAIHHKRPLTAAWVRRTYEGSVKAPALAFHLEAGKAALANVRWADAIGEFHSALRHDPMNAEAADGLQKARVGIRADADGLRKAMLARMTAGQAALKAERWADAERELKEALELDPKSAEAADGLRAVARLSVTAGQKALTAEAWADATRAFNTALRLDPKNPEATAGLQKIAERVEKATLARVTAGRAALTAERWADAEKEFKEALKLDPKNPDASLGILKAGDGLVKAGVAPHLAAGQAALKAEDWVRAEAAFNAALKLDPRHADAAVGLRTARIRQKGTNILIEELGNRLDRDVRRQAADALGDLGPAAKAAVPALRKALDDISADVRNAAKAALKKIEP